MRGIHVQKGIRINQQYNYGCRFRLSVFRPTQKVFNFKLIVYHSQESEAVFFTEHRPRVHEFLD